MTNFYEEILNMDNFSYESILNLCDNYIYEKRMNMQRSEKNVFSRNNSENYERNEKKQNKKSIEK
ncbi:hypothetical protein KAZ01_01020 [Candidatus Gracilibacteria bacterium]|nr:hypothetical protein [Candidatus Gracilibacteria bacterium]